MSDDRVTETYTHTTGPAATPTHNTTIVERRGGGGGMLIGLAVLIAVVVAAFFLFSQNRNEAVRTDAISSAAKSVGEGAAKVGDAAQDAADKVAPSNN